MRRPAFTALLLLVLAVLLLRAPQPTRAQCPADCVVTTANAPHKKYDFSPLKGKSFTTTSDGGVEYSFSLCGTDTTSCPEDGDGEYTWDRNP